jgi:predicted MFS family arabinose efflux permease
MVYTAVEITLFTTLLALGADIVPESRRVQGLGVLGISGLLPIGIGSILGDIVVGDDGFTRLFVLSSGLALVSWSLAWRLPDLASADPLRERHRGFRYVAGQRDLLPVWLVTGSFALGMITLFTYMRTYVDATGIGSVGLYFGTYAAVAVVVRLVGGSWADRLGASRMLIPAMTAMVLQFVLLGAATSATLLVAAAAAGGFGHGLVFPILTTLVVDRAAREERGTALAVFSGLFDVIVLVGAPLVGIAIESSGYGRAFQVVGAAVAAGLVGFVLWDRRVRTPPSIHRVGGLDPRPS